jgi:adenylate cyclase
MSDEDWRRVLTEGETGARLYRRLIRKLPANPRCKMCLSPFAGVGGYLGRLGGNGPSRKNPAFCRGCFEADPIGGAEVDVGILFADVRGYTRLAESRAPNEVAHL